MKDLYVEYILKLLQINNKSTEYPIENQEKLK